MNDELDLSRRSLMRATAFGVGAGTVTLDFGAVEAFGQTAGRAIGTSQAPADPPDRATRALRRRNDNWVGQFAG